MDLSELTTEQLAELEAKIAEEKLSKERARKEQINTYKDLVSDAIHEAFARLKDESLALSRTKQGVYRLSSP